MRFFFLDHWYDAALADWRHRAIGAEQLSFEDQRRSLMEFCHGTADFWEQALKALGHEATTVVANAETCQTTWADEHNFPTTRNLIVAQIEDYEPDYVCVQNVGVHPPRFFGEFPAPYLVAFCSYAARDEDLIGWDLVITSIPHVAERVRAMCGRALLLPLAFSPLALERTAGALPVPAECEPRPDRDLDCVFAGGLGHTAIWSRGEQAMRALALRLGDRFHWFGYGIERLAAPDPLLACYRGEAWGPQYFFTLLRAKIVVNRHGEVARGAANNMRLFEATGCGACLVTEEAANLNDYFEPGLECETYESPNDLPDVVEALLDDEPRRKAIASAGRRRTRGEHTYERRAKKLLEALA